MKRLLRRPARFALAAVATGMAVLAGLASPVSAHAELVESVPRAFATVPESPESIVLRFDEPVETALATIQIYDSAETLVDSPVVEAGAAANRSEVVARSETLAPGTYVVVWSVTSSDGHLVDGAFPFTIGGSDTDTGTDMETDQQELLDAVVSGVASTQSLTAALGVARWIGYLGFVVLVGVVVVAGSSPLIAQRRMAGLWSAGALAVLGSSLSILMMHGADAVRGGWADAVDLDLVSATLETRLGASLVVRVAAVVVLAAAVSRRRRSADAPASAWWANLVAMAALVLAGTWAASGHATAAEPAPVTIALHGVHMLAVGVWVGGLFTIVVAGDRAGPAVVAAFSRRAGIAVPAAVLAGVGLEWMLVRDLSVIGDNSHSRALIVKVALVGVVLVFAAAARAAFRAARPDGVRRATAAEAVLAVAVLGATAVMVDFSPRERTRVESTLVTLVQAGATATVEITSASTGPSQVHVYLTPSGGSLERATDISGRLRIPADIAGSASRTVPVEFAVSGANHWTAFVDFPYPGNWSVEFSVTMPGPSTLVFSGAFDVSD